MSQQKSTSIKDILNALTQAEKALLDELQLEKKIAKTEILSLSNELASLSDSDDKAVLEEAEKNKAELSKLEGPLAQSAAEVARLKEQVEEAKETLKNMAQQHKDNRAYPSARYAVNLYREISKITWQIDDGKPHEIKGFVSSRKSGVKSFCFDSQKQSQFFITNSLWDLAKDEDSW
ncbi:uncharacterized protein LOC131957228 [Physella acuta]|uniref:uncharacterized protein LOC131957228 n=1 Tax=Physella acuta TaxID=109671 RepID=UPI0027DC3E0D|nr:uncharacterized protein LOC131957228 [Physella acuta]